MRPRSFVPLIISIAISELAGLIGSVFTAPSIPIWYAALAKPSVNPPAWVFGPVWATLYALMGVAAFLVWQRGPAHVPVKRALVIFCVQLLLNAAWSIIFFGAHAPGVALLDLAALWFAIIATIVTFAKISRAAAWLLIPYLAWVSFAGYLNYAIWVLN